MSVPAPYPLQLEFHADRHITHWRPLVQWLLAIPHLELAEEPHLHTATLWPPPWPRLSSLYTALRSRPQ